MNANSIHEPVMLSEALGILAIRCGGAYVDATFGYGGHSSALCEAVGPCGTVIGLDRDPSAVERGRSHVVPLHPNLRVVHANFAEMAEVVRAEGFDEVDGVLMDLGVSSGQLDPDSGRGFSFASDEPLDMRMDTDRGRTAAEVLRDVDEDELTALLWRYADERHARRIARAVVEERARPPIVPPGRLARIVREAVPGGGRGERIDPATRTFMALRIHVNDEFASLERGLRGACQLLRRGGVLCVLSYHSGEDRIVKRFFAAGARGCVCPPELPVCQCGVRPWLDVLTRRPLRPTAEETERNPRSRSCRLRAARRTGEVPSDGSRR